MSPTISIQLAEATSPSERPVEIVERKGVGHPDSICDALAEHISVRLSRHYLEHCGLILHHNVDKLLLCGGAARPVFGGGEILEPIEIYIAGRATQEYRGARIPAREIAEEACWEWFKTNLPTLDLDRHVRIIPRLRPGSTDLTRLFAKDTDVPLANDTSCGAGFAPLTELERVVLEVERHLNRRETKDAHPEIGFDIKVMGVRRGGRIDLTIGCAFIDRFVKDVDDYVLKKARVRQLAIDTARLVTERELAVVVNAADDVDRGDVFLTVLGTSAEAGDDGEVGRGNRASGLITPYRRMTMEATAGKNPISHVGKLYNLVAIRIAAAIRSELPDVKGATCVLVSQIGRPVDEPQVIDIDLSLGQPRELSRLAPAVQDIARAELTHLPMLRHELLSERVSVF